MNFIDHSFSTSHLSKTQLLLIYGALEHSQRRTLDLDSFKSAKAKIHLKCDLRFSVSTQPPRCLQSSYLGWLFVPNTPCDFRGARKKMFIKGCMTESPHA